MTERLAWYVARSSGWVALVFLAATVVWGVLGAGRLVERRGWPRWLAEMHRHLSGMTIALTAVHLGALVADSWVHVGWRELLVPGAIAYRPGAVAWGVVALYLLVVVQLSSLLRRRLPRSWWHGLHLLSYPAVWLVVVHGLQAGTDAARAPVRTATMAVAGSVAFVTLLRLLGAGRTPYARRRCPSPAGSSPSSLPSSPPSSSPGA